MWRPQPDWTGEDAFVIGGGASIRNFPFPLLTKHHTIGCNEAFRLGAGVCSVVHFGDATWWHRVKWDLAKFSGPVVCSSPSLKHIRQQNFHYVHREKHGVRTDGRIGWNFSTGASAINLALLYGASRVYLLGMDLGVVDKRTHWHSNYTKPTREPCFQRFLRGFACVFREYQRAFPGTQVINVVSNGSSRLELFPTMELEDLIAQLKNDEHHLQNAQADGCLVGAR